MSIDQWALFSGVTLVTLGVLMGVNSYRHERRVWNGGICPECGNRWVYFDTDSQGGIGFRCGCGRSCWISFRSVLRGG